MRLSLEEEFKLAVDKHKELQLEKKTNLSKKACIVFVVLAILFNVIAYLITGGPR